MSIIGGILYSILTVLYYFGKFLLSLWWIYVPWILFVVAWSLWLKYIWNKHVQSWDWVLLEVIPPRDIKQTPKVMEQFFAGLHGAHQSGLNNWEIFIQGQTQKWFSFELVSLGGEVHFYIRTVSSLRNLVEAHIYAQYPDAEIRQVADYVDLVPTEMFSQEYNLWGTEMIFTKPDDCYPIRTYIDFEKDAMNEDQRIDPLSALFEVLCKIGPGEQIWLQTLVRPGFFEWKKNCEALRDKLMTRIKRKEEGLLKKEAVAWKDVIKAEAYKITTGKVAEGGDGINKIEEERWKSLLERHTKTEDDIIRAVEDKSGKIGFDTIIRFIYLAKQEVYQPNNVQSVIGAYKVFGDQNTNGLKPSADKVSVTAVNYWWQFKKSRVTYRKRKILGEYRQRFFPQYSPYNVIPYLHKPLLVERLPILRWLFMKSQPILMNIEELASIYHFPTEPVKAPLVPKIEVRRGKPPIDLPIE